MADGAVLSERWLRRGLLKTGSPQGAGSEACALRHAAEGSRAVMHINEARGE